MSMCFCSIGSSGTCCSKSAAATAAAYRLQLFELLLSFVGPQRFHQQLEAALPQMVYVSIAYLQMTQVGGDW